MYVSGEIGDESEPVVVKSKKPKKEKEESEEMESEENGE